MQEAERWLLKRRSAATVPDTRGRQRRTLSSLRLPCSGLPSPCLCAACPACIPSLFLPLPAHLRSLPSPLCVSACQAEARKFSVRLPPFPNAFDAWAAEEARWKQVWVQAVAGIACCLLRCACQQARCHARRKAAAAGSLGFWLAQELAAIAATNQLARCLPPLWQPRRLAACVPMPARCC
mgnify:CR=1 FL=1